MRRSSPGRDLLGVQAGGVLEEAGERGGGRRAGRRRPGRRGTASAGPRARVRRRGARSGCGEWSRRCSVVGDEAAVERHAWRRRRAERAPGAVARARTRSRPAPKRASRVARAAASGSPVERVRVGAGGDQVAVVALARGGDDAVGRGGADAAPRRLHGAAEGLRVGAGWPAARGRRARRGPRRARRGRASRARGAGSRRRRARPASGRWRSRCGRARGSRPAAMPAASASAISPATQRGLVAVGREAARGRSARRRRASRSAPSRCRCGLWRDARDGGVRGSRRASGSCAPSTIARWRGVALAEGEDVARLGAAEAVDRLVVVADHGHVAVGAGEQVHERGLRLVGVLHLVDDQPAPARRAGARAGAGARAAAAPRRRAGRRSERVAALELGVDAAPHGGDQRRGRGSGCAPS